MAGLKKILVSLPDKLLKEVDTIISSEKTNRNEFISEAMRFYIREKKKINRREKMAGGYKEMAEINISYAEDCIEVDNEVLKEYEERLGEMEK